MFLCYLYAFRFRCFHASQYNLFGIDIYDLWYIQQSEARRVNLMRHIEETINAVS